VLIALDAMGGDHAPAEICKGAVLACKQYGDIEIALVGDPEAIKPHIEATSSETMKRIHVVEAEDTIDMAESPAVAIRKKRKSSLHIAMQMVRSGESVGCVSAGNTGAIVAGGVLIVGRIKGIDRPGLGIPLPALERISLLIDVGATVRCKPLNLYQFGLMGDVYMRTIQSVEQPRIGLLSNGSEEIKGDELIQEARNYFKDAPVNFAGNVEGQDIPIGVTDVVVCEGLTGNILLKFIEGTGEALFSLIRGEIERRFLPKVGMMFMLPMLKELSLRFDYERTGGAPLLGVNGAVIKAHGRSKARAVSSALGVARDFVRKQGVQTIVEELEEGGVQIGD
jgi:glycerol-3-phosphate acyltransferase PlsX